MSESKADLGKLRVVDLKQRLTELGLPVGGLKAELVSRLHKHVSELQEREDDESETPATDDQQPKADSDDGLTSFKEHIEQQQQPDKVVQQQDAVGSPRKKDDFVQDTSSDGSEELQPSSGQLLLPTVSGTSLSMPIPEKDANPVAAFVVSPTAGGVPAQVGMTTPPPVGVAGPPLPTMTAPVQVGALAGHGGASSVSAPIAVSMLGADGSLTQQPPALMQQMLTPPKAPSAAPMLPQQNVPPPVLLTVPPTPVSSNLVAMDPDALMQQKVRQQQMLLEQQKNSQKQEDLFRLQQQAMLEKQKEENEKQARLLSLQQEAFKQNENEQMQLQALGLKPLPKSSPVVGHAMSMPTVDTKPISVESDANDSPNEPGNSLSRGVGELLAAMQQRQVQSTGMPRPAPDFMPPIGGAGSMQPPMPVAPQQSRQMGIMSHNSHRMDRPGMGRGGHGRMRHGGPMGHSGESPHVIRQSTLRHPGSRSGDDRPPSLMSLHVSAPKDDMREMRLPQALEEALAYKQQRAQQVGVTLDEEKEGEEYVEEEEEEEEEEEQEEEEEGDEEAGDDYEDENNRSDDGGVEFTAWGPPSVDMDWTTENIERQNGLISKQEQSMDQQGDDDDDDDDDDKDADDDEIVKEKENLDSKSSKKDKLRRKKKKKKKKKKGKFVDNQTWIEKQLEQESNKKEALALKKSKPLELMVEVSYVQEEIALDYSDPLHRHFAKVFENFKISEPEAPTEELNRDVKSETSLSANTTAGMDLKKVPKLAEDTDEDSDEEQSDKPKISKRKMKLLRRMSIAELKQTVNRPDVVEMHDVTARDPKLLVHLKATRNTVPVPRHWCFKRKYLQGKRGIEKPPFELPDFIKRTGIMEMRAALQEKEDQKTLKAKMRDKVRPKMGKIDIDYQKLHDAFFKWQSKPEMSVHGDLYYEGKEYETKMKDKKPGEMSDDLRIALGMPVGANAHKVPPPWLIAMQRYGPPPSYPNLKIPGLNAPIPDGCSFGYHAGGWGKPPVDNMGKPIYGDVFGTQSKENEVPMIEEEVENTLWGELESESEEESEEEESSEEEEDTSGLITPGDTGLITPSGISSLPAGLETPDMIELRKKHPEAEVEGGETPAALYTILPEKRVEGVTRGMMASTHTYDMSAATGGRAAGNQAVDVALDPSELDLVDTDAMAARYEATIREQQAGEDEDFSDMVAEHAAKQRNKRRRLQHQDQNKPAKKYKDFKF